jgi:hypothetical protein
LLTHPSYPYCNLTFKNDFLNFKVFKVFLLTKQLNYEQNTILKESHQPRVSL